jgi:hypothetical protein
MGYGTCFTSYCQNCGSFQELDAVDENLLQSFHSDEEQAECFS